ncbi:hypothetical protein E4U11_003592 [Claviceps purpurea]|nr:hypothetical protein E4U11_003592 [Claviceps purpurea]
MQRMLTWAGKGGVRKIKIATDVRFSNAALTVLMKASPSLEHLEILTLDGLTLPSKEEIWNQLRHISIITHQRLRYNDADRPGCFPQTFIQNAASSLEHLDFVGIPQEWYGMRPAIPNLPNLKTLRIGDHDDYDPDSDDNMDDYFDLGMIRTPFPIVPLARAFPKLEQLCIGPDVPCLAPSIGRTGQNKWEDIWPNLKVFAFHLRSRSDFFTESSRSTLRYLTRLNSLQHISLGVESWEWPCMFSGSYDPLPDLDVNQRSEFQNLRSFSSETLCVSPDGARTLLSNAIKSNQLTSFDFVFPYDTDRHLKGYDWLRGSPSIQTLGCYKYRFPFDLANADDLLLPQFLATFPNLRTLRIKLCSTAEPPQLAKLLLAIFSVTHLKTVYTSVYEDKFVVRLRKVAQGYGVKLINNEPDYDGQWHRYEAWSHPWPIPSSALGA